MIYKDLENYLVQGQMLVCSNSFDKTKMRATCFLDIRLESWPLPVMQYVLGYPLV